MPSIDHPNYSLKVNNNKYYILWLKYTFLNSERMKLWRNFKTYTMRIKLKITIKSFGNFSKSKILLTIQTTSKLELRRVISVTKQPRADFAYTNSG